MFVGVKNNSKNFGSKNMYIRLFCKILSKLALFYSKSSIFLGLMVLSVSKSHKSFEKSKYLINMCICINIDFYEI